MSAPLSLPEALAQIPDPRSRQGRRHPLSAILSLAVLAMLTGCKTYEAIAQFGRQRGFALAHALGFLRGKTPCKSTLSLLFRALDAAAFEAALSAWVASRLPVGEGLVISLDGKTVRGSKGGDVPGQHLVAAYCSAAQAVLAQVKVDAKTNEHKAALELLGILPISGCIFTGDAMFCQRDVCAKVIEGGGDYVFVVKDNQPSLAIDIAAGLAYQAQARRLQAAFPPLRGAAAAGGLGGAECGQGARPARGPDAADDDHPDQAPAVGGPETGLRIDARADLQGQDECGGGTRDSQPGPAAGRRRTPAGADARALGHRERPALQARRDDGGRPKPGAQGRGAAGDGGAAQRRHPRPERGGGAQPRLRHAYHE
jgi:DDE family transposase